MVKESTVKKNGEGSTSFAADKSLKRGSRITFYKWCAINSVKKDSRDDWRFIKPLINALFPKEKHNDLSMDGVNLPLLDQYIELGSKKLRLKFSDKNANDVTAVNRKHSCSTTSKTIL